jgi:surface antigen
MPHASRFGRHLVVSMVMSGALLIAVPVNVYGEPPPWAPAHGWRKKNDPHYVGYTGRKWSDDYGILAGRCNREAVGAVLGGAVGGAVGDAVGSQVARRSDRPIAILVGAVAGAVLGAHLGREMDRADHACVAHALELAGPNRRVEWRSADGRTSYLLTPLAGFKQDDRACREFNLQATRDRRRENGQGKACQMADGTWQIVG